MSKSEKKAADKAVTKIINTNKLKVDDASDAIDQRFGSIAMRHLDPKKVKVADALGHFASHLKKNVPEEKLAKMTDDDATAHANDFFAAHAASNPSVARVTSTPTSRELAKKHGLQPWK